MGNISSTSGFWSTITFTISSLLESNPTSGIVILILSIIIFASIVAIITTSTVLIIRAKKEKKDFTKSALALVKDETKIYEEGTNMIRRHTIWEFHTVIDRQMREFENSLDRLENNAMEIFNTVWEENQMSPSYEIVKDFESSMTLSREAVLNIARQAMRLNHIADKTNSEYELYIESQLSIMQMKGLSIFRNSYTSSSVSPYEFESRFSSYWSEGVKEIRDAFYKARAIAIEYQNIIIKEREEHNEIRANFISSIPKYFIQES